MLLLGVVAARLTVERGGAAAVRGVPGGLFSVLLPGDKGCTGVAKPSLSANGCCFMYRAGVKSVREGTRLLLLPIATASMGVMLTEVSLLVVGCSMCCLKQAGLVPAGAGLLTLPLSAATLPRGVREFMLSLLVSGCSARCCRGLGAT